MLLTRQSLLFAVPLALILSSSIRAQDDSPPKLPALSLSSKTLRSEPVRSELELTDKQLEDIQKIQKDLFKEIREIRDQSVEDRKNGLPGATMEEMAELVQRKTEESDARISKEILLGFQSERFNQIRWRMELARIGIDRFLREKPVAAFLGMTKKEEMEFYNKASKAKRRFQKEAERLRKEMQKEILASMPKRCQSKLDKLLGEELKAKSGR